MPKKPTAYHRPESLDEALALLAKPATFALAGGTRLLAGDVEGVVVDLQNLGLNRVEWADGRLHIGATTTLTNLSQALADQPEATPAALLQNGIAYAGPNTYRNAATLGGIIASRPADSELLAALLVLDAELLAALLVLDAELA
ncbi:MAG: FAD binding domain-containing protein, partial [Anaerolineae bacterium]